MDVTVATPAPLARRLWAWTEERFPPANAALFAVLYLAAILYGRSLAGPGPLALGAADVPGFAAVVAFFLLLRVLDEHKDYASDQVLYPERVLSRGDITLGHLKVVGALAVALAVAVTWWAGRGGPALWALALTLGWSALMAVEFFAHAWLSRRLVLYALSHMLVMPLALGWMAELGAPGVRLPPAVLLLGALAFLSGFAFEITRKTRAPEAERSGVDSYTKRLGIRGAVLLIAALELGQAAVLGVLLYTVGAASVGWWLGLGATLLLPLTMLWRFLRAPSSRGAKHNEAAVALAMLAGYAILIAALIQQRGITWR